VAWGAGRGGALEVVPGQVEGAVREAGAREDVEQEPPAPAGEGVARSELAGLRPAAEDDPAAVAEVPLGHAHDEAAEGEPDPLRLDRGQVVAGAAVEGAGGRVAPVAGVAGQLGLLARVEEEDLDPPARCAGRASTWRKQVRTTESPVTRSSAPPSPAPRGWSGRRTALSWWKWASSRSRRRPRRPAV